MQAGRAAQGDTVCQGQKPKDLGMGRGIGGTKVKTHTLDIEGSGNELGQAEFSQSKENVIE